MINWNKLFMKQDKNKMLKQEKKMKIWKNSELKLKRERKN